MTWENQTGNSEQRPVSGERKKKVDENKIKRVLKGLRKWVWDAIRIGFSGSGILFQILSRVQDDEPFPLFFFVPNYSNIAIS